jgi:SAM-dependent methyltransferase
MPRLGDLVPGPLRPYARSAKRWLKPGTTDAPLSSADAHGELQLKQYATAFEAGKPTAVPVRVTNRGGVPWSGRGSHPVSLKFRWTTSRRQPLEKPVITAELPTPIYPGEAVEVPVTLTAPTTVGRCLVEISLVQNGGPDLTPGVRPLLLDADVTGPVAEDIDYHSAFATADLAVDYWTVVGPSTREEFDRLAEAKMVHLREVGVTPASRILDVGCGTGQLAFPLEKYLSDNGAYTGTDIGEEAIPFCRDRFTRPNFKFLQSEMTKIPLIDESYDIAMFFSVFTHTYPDETALLLADTKRLLAPGGTILGDFFVTTANERCAGNRGKMEVNADHLARLVALVGLEMKVLHDWPQSPHLSRRLYTFTHAVRGVS